MVLNTIKSRDIPVGFRALLIASIYFIVTGTTQVFSNGGNNIAKALPAIFLFGDFRSIFYYAISTIVGFLLGFAMLFLMRSQAAKISKEKYPDNVMMEHPEDAVDTNNEADGEIEEEKSRKLE